MSKKSDPAAYVFALLPLALIVAGLALMTTLLPFANRSGAGTATTPTAAVLQSIQAAFPAPLVGTPDRSAQVTRLAFGSCFRQDLPAPIWSAIAESKPDAMLMLGDNVYGDTRSGTPRELIAAYRAMAAASDFQVARDNLKFLAVWDDHDYGMNDGGRDYALRSSAEAIFRAVWGDENLPPAGGGIYRSEMLGPDNARVQIIFLDTRSFRTGLTPKPPESDIFGKYVPTDDPNQTILGPAQWAWLEGELEKAADVRILVSSIQVLSEGHGWERWGNFPKEQARLLDLLETKGPEELLILSGDRHNGSVYVRPGANGRRIVEVTSSSLNRPYPNRDTPGSYRRGPTVDVSNFGLIEIDWAKRELTVGLRDDQGNPARDGETLRF